MRDVRIDGEGALRCWKCGGKGFTSKRTGRSKLLVGVGTLATKKKLKCQSCGEYNQTGSAKPYAEPAPKRRRGLAGSIEARMQEQEARMQAKKAGAATPPVVTTAEPDPPPPSPPAGFYNDPRGEAGKRWWDGNTWTDHTQD